MRLSLYELRLILSAATRRAGLLPNVVRPVLATLNLTENCQCRCVMCDYWRLNKRNVISTSRAKGIVGELAGVGIEHLRFLGGEPLLRSDLFRILESAATLPFQRIILATNGLLLDRLFGAVNESCITDLTVSVDGLPETTDLIRGLPGYFDHVMTNLERISGKRIKIATLVTRRLANEICDWVEYCQGRGYDLDLVLPSFDLPYAKSGSAQAALTDMWPTPQQVECILDAMLGARLITGSIADGCYEYLVERRYPFSRCMMGYVAVLVRANEDLTMGCYEMKPVGNVLETSASELIEGAKALAQAQSMYRLECSRCVCGWQISRVFAEPVSNLAYVRKRLGQNRAKYVE